MYKKIKYLILILTIQQSVLALKENNITVFGIGKLGLCTALCLEKAGYNVLGVDIMQHYIDKINSKNLISPEPYVTEYLKKSNHFTATTSLEKGIEFSDVYFINVATPSTPHPEAYDHSMLSKLLFDINSKKVENKTIVICCTVFPGYIRSIGNHLLLDCKNTSLSYNPEFIAQGNIIKEFENPDMVLIGQGSHQAGNILETIYRKVCKNNPTICRMSPESAEITKLAINCYITTKIAFANMIGDVAQLAPGANEIDILNAIGSDSRIGNKNLKYGFGFGGACFPRDNRALGNYLKLMGVKALIPQSTDESNKLHKTFMVEQLLAENRDEYIFEDVNYKDNCNVIILEESQKLAVAQEIAKRKHKVIIYDSQEVISELRQKFGNLFKYRIKNMPQAQGAKI
ncbi:MAG: nucleotide sugar dehydrogenase [Candidatus Babeliales bacterium]|nr:nucleotide sugar dehydrogenase [Candidatus Babeliales bacterium]